MTQRIHFITVEIIENGSDTDSTLLYATKGYIHDILSGCYGR